MQVVIPSGCGNSPRLQIVAEFVVDWAAGADESIADHLADDATWEIVGNDTFHGSAAITHGGQRDAEHLEILTVINHGRSAACEGFMQIGGERTEFCHLFQFTGVAKTAKITSIRTFYIEAS